MPDEIETDVKLVQSKNVLSPIDTTEEGMFTELRLVHLSKAPSTLPPPISITVLGMFIVVSFEQL